MFNLRAAHRSSTPLPETPMGQVFWLNSLDMPMMGMVKHGHMSDELAHIADSHLNGRKPVDR